MSIVYLFHVRPDTVVPAAGALGRQGHEVSLFSSADDLLDAAVRESPDLVVAAMNSLTAAGERLVEALRRRPQTADVPFLAVDAASPPPPAGGGYTTVHPAAVAPVAAELLAAGRRSVDGDGRGRPPVAHDHPLPLQGGVSMACALWSRAKEAAADLRDGAPTRLGRRRWGL